MKTTILLLIFIIPTTLACVAIYTAIEVMEWRDKLK